MTQLVQQFWSLNTHPFRPAANGGALLSTLDPRKDSQWLQFYYDLYDWQHSTLLNGLDPGMALTRFPATAELADPKSLLILIAGAENTGRESLCNLILHKIKLQFNQELLVTEAILDTKNPSENIKAAARLFMSQYDLEELAPSYEELNKFYLRETGAQAKPTSTYSTLFQMWKPRVRRACARPLILLLRGGESYDNWKALYESTAHLFDFVIVLATKVTDAETCNQLLKTENKNVVLIKARKLAVNDAVTYLQARLRLLRVPAGAQPNSLLPFTAAALQSLYAPGPTAEGKPVEWEIGMLNKSLCCALDDHIGRLEILLKQGRPAASFTPAELQIDAAAIQQTRQRINQGG